MMMKSIFDNPYIDEEAKKVIRLFDNLYTEKDIAVIWYVWYGNLLSIYH